MNSNTMNSNILSPFLRRVLLADALLCVLTGLLFVLGTGLLAELLQLPATLLYPLGIFLLPYGALVAYVGTRVSSPRWAVWAIILANVLWVGDSFFLLMSGWVTPNILGTAFVIFQAVVVALFATLQYVGLREQVKAVA